MLRKTASIMILFTLLHCYRQIGGSKTDDVSFTQGLYHLLSPMDLYNQMFGTAAKLIPVEAAMAAEEGLAVFYEELGLPLNETAVRSSGDATKKAFTKGISPYGLFKTVANMIQYYLLNIDEFSPKQTLNLSQELYNLLDDNFSSKKTAKNAPSKFSNFLILSKSVAQFLMSCAVVSEEDVTKLNDKYIEEITRNSNQAYSPTISTSKK